MSKSKRYTTAQLIAVMKKMRHAAALEYSFNGHNRRVYKDGFTRGWNARDEIARSEAERSKA